MRRRGITLVEIIVVMAILVILSGLVFSVMGGSMRKSKVTVSMMNLKQIHAAQMLYEQDSGDLPLADYYRPGFQRYFGGSAPEPPLAPPLASRKGTDRQKYAYHIQGTKSYPSVDQITRACIDGREESLPIAFDENFQEPSYSARNHEHFFLYIRRGGAIGRDSRDVLDLLESHPDAFPCPGAPHWANFQ